jgi:choline dehydrogenase-like flavoprotein
MIEIRDVKDVFAEGVDAGWKTVHAGQLRRDEVLECDVVIVGTGAGGGTAAEVLTQAGLDVVLIEEGPLRTSRDFRLDERTAYRDLYQEGAARATKDGSMIILQGRSVGGSTTVNWTSSFRTPEHTLAHWADVHGITGVQKEQMAPWFARMEKRLSIATWAVPANPNNEVIRRGCDKLGWSWESDSAQRERLLGSGLLRLGLSDQCQAVHADHHDSRSAEAWRTPVPSCARRENPARRQAVRVACCAWACSRMG